MVETTSINSPHAPQTYHRALTLLTSDETFQKEIPQQETIGKGVLLINYPDDNPERKIEFLFKYATKGKVSNMFKFSVCIMHEFKCVCIFKCLGVPFVFLIW